MQGLVVHCNHMSLCTAINGTSRLDVIESTHEIRHEHRVHLRVVQ